jgi:methionyl-tRNA formyltransferase
MVKQLRILFFGTPAFAVATLEALAGSRHSLVGVVTQPDRPRGRGLAVQPDAVKTAALAHGLDVWQPESLAGEPAVSRVRSMSADLAVVAAYGRLLPDAFLALPPLGVINVHASLLPRWRGATPVHHAVLSGDVMTGVSIMRVVRALDAGPVLAAAALRIGADESSLELEDRLARIGARLALGVVDRLSERPLMAVPQDETRVTYARRLTRRDSAIDWTLPAADVHRRVRGLQPWPLASTGWRGRRVVLLASTVASVDGAHGPPGGVLAAAASGIDVACGQGVLRLLRVRPDGRAAQSAGEFANGHRVAVGDSFSATLASS